MNIRDEQVNKNVRGNSINAKNPITTTRNQVVSHRTVPNGAVLSRDFHDEMRAEIGMSVDFPADPYNFGDIAISGQATHKLVLYAPASMFKGVSNYDLIILWSRGTAPIGYARCIWRNGEGLFMRFEMVTDDVKKYKVYDMEEWKAVYDMLHDFKVQADSYDNGIVEATKWANDNLKNDEGRII
jgi:hypothetical protein